MYHHYHNKRNNSLKIITFLGILFISFVGCLFHYLYELSGKQSFVSIVSPVNESVWEHLKIAFYPTILWYILSYFLMARKKRIPFSSWFFSSVLSSLVSTVFIVVFYYTYTGAFAIQSLILEIASLFLGVILAQMLSLYVFQRANLRYYHHIISTLVFVSYLTAFVVFTFIPPQYPIFMDSSTGIYGVQ